MPAAHHRRESEPPDFVWTTRPFASASHTVDLPSRCFVPAVDALEKDATIGGVEQVVVAANGTNSLVR
jgi:hypothetical protein